MKKIFPFLILLFLVTSCQKKKEILRLNLVKGKTYSQKMTLKSTVNQFVNDQYVVTILESVGEMNYKVVNVSDSLYDLESTFRSVSMKISMLNNVVEFSSEKKDKNDILSSILGSFKNKPFIIRMTPTGKVREIKNIENVFSGMFDNFPNLSDEQKQGIQNQIMQSYGANSVKGNLEMTFAIFPDNQVRKGDKWIVNTQLESGMSAKIETTYEFKGETKSNYLLSGVSRIEAIEQKNYSKITTVPMKYNLSGSMTSRIKIDKTSGWVVESSIDQNLKGVTQVKANPQFAGGSAAPITIPITIHNEMSMKE